LVETGSNFFFRLDKYFHRIFDAHLGFTRVNEKGIRFESGTVSAAVKGVKDLNKCHWLLKLGRFKIVALSQNTCQMFYFTETSDKSRTELCCVLETARLFKFLISSIF
jgi:hypothetical protein